VVDNNDPAGLGRIKVQFAWQDGDTPWLRMTSAHAGGGKGMYFVPEIGEEVLVAFENDNAEKPFVLGSMYNGNESSGYASGGNDNKVIQTRSGCKILINDAVGSIFLEDPSGNTWMMDGNGNISVNAPNRISMSCADMDINVANNFTTSVGMNKTNLVGANHTETIGGMKNTAVSLDMMTMVTGKLTEMIEGDKESKVEKDNQTIVNGEKSTQVNENYKVHSETEVHNNAAENSKQF
jgi:type VI secretion system secreted protein VgrG